jgi:hypothetical protein
MPTPTKLVCIDRHFLERAFYLVRQQEIPFVERNTHRVVLRFEELLDEIIEQSIQHIELVDISL